MEGISIIVCCFNSCSRLHTTLFHLANQKSIIPYEVIVVDNASSDDTFLQTQKIWSLFNSSVTLKVIQELQPGLSFARHTGIKQACYEYIVFCDDDNWLEENYIQEAYNFLCNNPTYAAIGGCSEAVFQDGCIPPKWFNEIQGSYAVGAQGADGDITNKGSLWGAGLSFKKSIYNQVINIDYPTLLTGRKGTDLTSGEDTEFCVRCILIGYKLYCSSALSFKHYIPKNRLTNDYKIKLFKGFEYSGEIIGKYNHFIRLYNSNNNLKIKLITVLKYLLHLIKIRKLYIFERFDIYTLYPLIPLKKDRDFMLIHNLRKTILKK